MNKLNFILLLVFIFLNTACGTMGKDLKAFLSGKKSAPQTSTQANASGDVVRFSDSRNLPVGDNRQYRRMTKKQFEDESLYSDNAGSLWVMEGQDSYLFSENIVRLPGDLLNVMLEGQPEKQLSSKAQVIKDLIKKLEKKKKQLAGTAPAGTEGQAKPAPAAAGTEAKAPDTQAANQKADSEENSDGLDVPFDVKVVPTRIVERMSDGNYRVKGSQTVMIGNREYKVIVTGLVRPTDVNQNNVDSSKMLDSRFDIVKYNRGKTL